MSPTPAPARRPRLPFSPQGYGPHGGIRRGEGDDGGGRVRQASKHTHTVQLTHRHTHTLTHITPTLLREGLHVFSLNLKLPRLLFPVSLSASALCPLSPPRSLFFLSPLSPLLPLSSLSLPLFLLLSLSLSLSSP